jgi:hypothetical protein
MPNFVPFQRLVTIISQAKGSQEIKTEGGTLQATIQEQSFKACSHFQ